METTQTKSKAAITDIQAKLAKLGFKGAKRLGMNILEHNVGETVIVRVTGPISVFESNKIDPKTKLPAKYDYVTVTNLESGEADMTYWLSGQIKYQFNQMEEYVNQSFAITALGKTEVDGTEINQFDIQLLEN